MRNLSELDLTQLLRKYDKAGPRYTSYPPLPVFASDYGSNQSEIDIILNNHKSSADLSLYIHIPFCHSLCWFCGCTTVVTPNREHVRTYLQYLKKEIQRISQYVSRNREVVQLHWGGGTPTYLKPNEIEDLAMFLREKFTLSTEIEAGIEVDPRQLILEHLLILRASGFNRVSVGVQDFDTRVQKAVNRIQPEEKVYETIQWCRGLAFKSINIDLIYGLPLQTLASFERTIDEVIELSPDRIAVYNYAHVPWLKPHQKLIHHEDLPSTDTKLQILKMTIEKLRGAGYAYIGMDHFAKSTDELAIARRNKTLHRNFQGYSTKAGVDLYGFGMSAISHFGDVYVQNVKTLREYYEAIDNKGLATQRGHRMTEDDRIRNHVIMRLMCDGEVIKSEVEDQFNILFDEYFDESLDRLQEFISDGLATNTLTKISVTELGRLFLRNIAMCFDVYIDELAKKQPMFSRAV